MAKLLSDLGVEEEIRALFGGMVTADWRERAVSRGHGWHTDAGAFSTPIVGGGAGTVLDQDQPELVIDVPAGWTMVPLRVHVSVGPGIQTTDDHETEVLIAYDRAAVSSASATHGTVETPTNMRSDRIGGCPLPVVSAVTVNMTNPTLGVELLHRLQRENFGDATGTELTEINSIYEPKTPHFIVGPATFLVYFGGDIAASGFINADFLAIPSAWVNLLS